MHRRNFIKSTGTLLTTLAVAPFIARNAQAAEESALVYLSPIKSNGALSSCQAEVWFVRDGRDIIVVTDAETWRAQAVRQGLSRTQVWEGDVGQWQSSDGKYKQLPASIAMASFEEDAVVHARMLQSFGTKYADGWGTWGPRFKNGLADGSRVMLRYRAS